MAVDARETRAYTPLGKRMKQDYLDRLVKWLIGATFFVPLIMAPSKFIFPFIVPKIVVFRSLVLLMLGGFLLLFLIDRRRYEVRMTPITLAFLLFLLSFALSTFLGVDWYHSFWDNHERMLGLFTIVHYILYYLIVTTVIREWRDWRVLLRLFLFAGGAVMTIGILQRFVNPTLLLNQSGSRVASTLGNPIYVGGYGLFLSFLGFFLLLKEERLLWRVYAAAGGLLGFFGIFLSGTRGSMLGWIAGAGVVLFGYAIFLRGHERLRRRLLTLIAIGAVTLGVLFFFRQEPWVERIPALGALLNSSLSSGTASTRIMAWGIAIDAWKERPIFGWGPNNYFYAFNKYYRPEFLEHGWGETWFDNAHNIVMNTLAVQGVVGIGAYLFLFGTVVVLLIRGYRRKTVDLHTAVVFVGFCAAHFVGNVFVFENPTSYLYFAFVLAFANSMASPAESAPDSAVKPGKVSFGVALTMTILVALLIFVLNINVARANIATLHTLRSLYSFLDPVAAYQAAVAIPSPHVDDIRNDFARTADLIIPEYVKQGKVEEGKRLLALAFDELQKNRALHPLDIRVQLQQAQLAQNGSVLFQNIELVFRAEEALLDALQKSPKRQQVQFTLAGTKLQLRKFDEAVALMQEAVNNDPKIPESWWRLALVLQEAGRAEEAIATIREARARGITFDARGEQIASAILPSEGATNTAP